MMIKTKLHQDWQFWKDGNEAGATTIQLPHDAMMSERRAPDMENGGGSGYYPGGKYWYKKLIYGLPEYKLKAVLVEFEGVYMNSTVYLNGEKVGGHIYGYTNFFVDLTGKMRIGEMNELLVSVDNSKTPNSRWYSGSGIYRPVQLWLGGINYIRPQGLRVKTVSINPAVIQIDSDMETRGAQSDITVEYSIYDGDTVIAVASGATTQVKLPDAVLWSAETPKLYSIKAVMKASGEVTDEAWERFGVRELAWSAEKGFQINGETIKLRGGCIHHDNGILGACTYNAAERRKMTKLKEFGFNAVRYSHYPAGKNLLDICDEVGMYVIDESFDQWRRPNTKYDYSIYFDSECEKDIAALANKDHNHPCVIMYSIGNEIADTGRSYAPEIAARLCGIIRQIDDTRPITIANNAPMSMISDAMQKLEGERNAEIGSIEINELISANPEIANAFKRGTYTAEKLESIVGGVFDELDIAGHNYAHEFYAGIHSIRPDRILLSAETFPSRMASNWKWVTENDWCIGDFHWTAWDYLGEAGVGLPVYGSKEAPFLKPYPCLTAACGSFDLIGLPEAAAYYAAILWGAYNKPHICVRPVNHSGEDFTVGGWRLTDAVNSWTWRGCEGKSAEICVYSAGREVALYQNGTLIDKKPLVDCKAEFDTVYCPGELTAVSFDDNGLTIDKTVLKTNGLEMRLSIRPEDTQIKADINDIALVPICVTDEYGGVCVMTDKQISVKVEGEGALIALGSGRPQTQERFSETQHTSWHGYVLAAIRLSGNEGAIRITTSAEGCEDTTAEIQCIA